MAIPQTFIQDLLARTDVVEVVGRYVQLKKSGANFFGLCPFHSEKTGSFSVSPSKQFYHCFSCGKNGNAIGFLMDYTGAGFVDAVHDLAQQCGMQVPEDDRSPAERARAAEATRQRATLSDVLARAADAWRDRLRQSPNAIAYLKQRGLSGEMARDFGLGYAPDGWRTLAGIFPDYSDPLLEEAGLVITHEDEPDKRYDRFRDRIMFPIRNVKGDVIGFGGRVLGDGTPKYLNSPETSVFHKGHELYGLYEARHALRERGYALVVEGYMDVVALAQQGFANTVATLGTACTPEHVRKLFRFTSNIVFSFDGDAAGQRAARKALESALPFASDVRSVKFLFLPPEHDPDSFIRTHGSDAFEQIVDTAVPLSRFLLDSATENCDLQSAEGRSLFAAQAQPLWQALPAGALAQQLLGEIATQVQIGNHELQQLWGLTQQRSRSVATTRQSSQRPARTPSSNRWRDARPTTHPKSAQTASNHRMARALQIVLTAPQAWATLSNREQELLCEQDEPWGVLFVWLAGQVNEHGPQPWSALREALRGHPHENTAVQEIQSLPDSIESDPDELHAIVQGERPMHLKKNMDAALANHDLALYQRLFRELAVIKQNTSEFGQ